MENAYSTTKQLLLSTATLPDTRTYRAVSHEQLINLTLESIYQSGFVIDKELYSSARDGNVANAQYTIKNVADSEMQLQIGFQNSLDKSLSLKFAIGTHVFICSNGCVSGDYGTFKKKHQGDIQTFSPIHIAEYIKSAGEVFAKMQREREDMKQIEISKRVCAELLGRMVVEEEILESTQLNIIRREISSPTFDYGADNSLWQLYQFCTFSMKEVHPSLYMKQHIAAHKFFVEAMDTITTPSIMPLILPEPIMQEF